MVWTEHDGILDSGLWVFHFMVHSGDVNAVPVPSPNQKSSSSTTAPPSSASSSLVPGPS